MAPSAPLGPELECSCPLQTEVSEEEVSSVLGVESSVAELVWWEPEVGSRELWTPPRTWAESSLPAFSWLKQN